MNYAILISEDSEWGAASGLSAMLTRLGFAQCADAAAIPALSRLLLMHWAPHNEGATSALDQAALPAGSVRFAVAPPDVSIVARATLAEQFDAVLTAPVDEIALCNALAEQHYDVLAVTEPRSLYAKALELACDDAATARQLLQLIVDTNRATLALLCDSFEAASWDAVGSAAHRIAGSARMLDCSGLIALLTRLEAAVRGREIACAKALLPLVVNALESLDVSVQEVLGSIVQH